MAKRWNMASYADMNALAKKLSYDSTDRIQELIIQQMKYIGERCIAIARDRSRANTWGDVTGNLRSSIGYIVQVNGKPIIQSQIEQFQGADGTKAKEGAKEARKLLQQLSGTKQSGIVLFVVAGMNYAEYVETIHRKDVLATSHLEGDRLAERLIGRLFSKTKK